MDGLVLLEGCGLDMVAVEPTRRRQSRGLEDVAGIKGRVAGREQPLHGCSRARGAWLHTCLDLTNCNKDITIVAGCGSNIL